MAKKQTKKTEVEEPYIEETPVAEAPVVEAPVVEAPVKTRKEPTFKKADDGWEIKNRTYFLRNRFSLDILKRKRNLVIGFNDWTNN